MTGIQEKLEEARERQEKAEKGEYPDAWKPEKVGDQLVGKLTSIEAGRNKKTANCLFWTVEQKDGKEFSVLECSTIRSGREREKIVVGDQVALEFRGTKKSKDGYEYKVFLVVKG
jgi:hypothetical protein